MSRSIKIIRIFLLSCILLPHLVLAWNYAGHMLISDLAYQELPAAQQKKLRKLLKPLLKKDSKSKKFSIAAKVSSYPDRWRNLTLSQIFALYDSQVPAALKELDNMETKLWHYQDNYIGKYVAKCNLPHARFNSQVVLDKLINVYPKLRDATAEGIVLIFIIHIMEDMHQPLHAMSKINKNCNSDYGANRFYLDKKHKHNLHQYWDEGAGFLAKPFAKDRKSPSAIPASPAVIPANAGIHALNLQQISNENLQYADFIYSTPLNKRPNAVYQAKAQDIVKQRIALAAACLAYVVEQLL